MADGATIVSAVDIAVEAAVDAEEVPAVEVAFDEAVNIVEFGYRVEGEVQYLDVSVGFWM